MDRIDKIRLLEAVADGKIKPGGFTPPVVGMFVETDKPGEYEAGGKIYNQEQFDAYCKSFHEANERRALFGLPETAFMVVLSGDGGNIAVPPEATKTKQEPPLQPEPMPEPIRLQLPEPEETFTEAETTNQAAPGEPEKPEVIVDQQENGRKKPVLLRNITDEFINQFLQW